MVANIPLNMEQSWLATAVPAYDLWCIWIMGVWSMASGANQKESWTFWLRSWHQYCICSIRWHGYYLFRPSILCSFYSRMATIRERHFFLSANPFADREESEVANEWLLGRQGNLLVVADWFTLLFWVCFTIVQDKFSCIHVLLKYSSRSLWLLLESSVYFIQQVLRCSYCSRAATNWEQCLIKRIQ